MAEDDKFKQKVVHQKLGDTANSSNRACSCTFLQKTG